MSHRSCAQITAEVASALLKGPRTRRDLAEYVGVARRRVDMLDKHLNALRESGLVFVTAWAPYNQPVFAWQGQPFSRQDVPRPVKPVKAA